MLCPRCSDVFDKEAARNINLSRRGKENGLIKGLSFFFNKSDLTYKASTQKTFLKKSQMKTFTPPSKSPTEKWLFSGGKKSNYTAPPTKWVKRVTSTNAQKETSNPKKFAYNNNYTGKNPMTKTQWRRFQHQKKDDALMDITNIEKQKEKQVTLFEMVRKPATERIFPPLTVVKENLTKDDDEMTSNFNSSEADFDVICVVSILPIECDVTSEIVEDDGDFTEEMVVHKPL
jgi:hypothetical protein